VLSFVEIAKGIKSGFFAKREISFEKDQRRAADAKFIAITKRRISIHAPLVDEHAVGASHIQRDVSVMRPFESNLQVFSRHGFVQNLNRTGRIPADEHRPPSQRETVAKVGSVDHDQAGHGELLFSRPGADLPGARALSNQRDAAGGIAQSKNKEFRGFTSPAEPLNCSARKKLVRLYH
jgi:hypothetical protein